MKIIYLLQNCWAGNECVVWSLTHKDFEFSILHSVLCLMKLKIGRSIGKLNINTGYIRKQLEEN